jgi:subtilase family serine protease
LSPDSIQPRGSARRPKPRAEAYCHRPCFARVLRLAFVLTPPHPAEEQQFLEDVQNEQSPLFHKFLSPEEWNARFVPSTEDEQKVVDWAESQGLGITNRG